MRDENETKKQLIHESAALRQRITELEKAEIRNKKTAEEALHRSEHLLNETQKITKVGGWEYDVESKRMTWTDEVYRIHGVSKEDYDPNNIKQDIEFYVPHDRHLIEQAFYRAVNEGVPYDLELQFVSSQGLNLWVRTIGKPILQDGKTIKVIGNIMDITERKKTEEALRESEARYRRITDAITDYIYTVRVEDGNVVETRHGPGCRAITGYSEEEFAADPYLWFRMVAEEDRAAVQDRDRRILAGEGAAAIEHRIVRKDGLQRWVRNIPAVKYDQQGSLQGYDGLIQDITLQKKLEEQLLHAQKMEAIGTLAGGVAHDFNNLLMGILGYTSLMLMKTEKSHPFYEMLKIIEKQVESGAELTRQLLGFARGGKYEVKPLNANDLIIKTSDIFGRTKKEIIIHKKLQDDLHSIEADRGQLEQVLLNLYVNAWQAMPSGGELYIETRNVVDEQFSCPYNAKPGPYIEIAVTDTGVGMDAETRNRIFEPFFTTKGVGRGTGLGLASAYGIIKNHGGIINVYSEKGHGTTFIIYLPASKREVAETKTTEGSLLTGDETILMVDDERVNIEAMKEILETLGYKVLTAQNGKKAIKLYREHSNSIRLVILDMIMPGMNGKETLEKLMEIDESVRVLMSSGSGINGEDNILDLGCKGFIRKPFRADELSRKIRTMLDGAH